MNQEDFASRIDKSARYISDIERGVRKPSLVTLVEIMQALKITPNELFCDLISYENDDITETVKFLSEISDEDRKFVMQFIDNYKRILRKK